MTACSSLCQQCQRLLIIGLLPFVFASSPGQAETNAQPASVLSVSPGVNELIPVAVDHLNRLVTPFDNPQIRTTSRAVTEVRDNVIYVATAESTPVALFITPEGEESPALSLTLVPRKVPPVDVILQLSSSFKGSSPAFSSASYPVIPTEHPQTIPRSRQLKQWLKQLATGKTPRGFYPTALTGEALPAIHCHTAGLTLVPGLSGTLANRQFLLVRRTVLSQATAPISLSPDTCRASGLAAAGVWPDATVLPGETTELLLVFVKSALTDRGHQPGRYQP